MKKVVLDTNFILSAIREKIDFLEDLEFLGFKVLVPEMVMNEIERIRDSDKKLKFKDEAKLALKMLDKNDFESVVIGGKYVDTALKRYLDEHPKIALATLDKELKRKVRNSKVIVRGKKKLEVQ